MLARSGTEFSQNYWVFGLCPSSSILKTRGHCILETGSVFVLRCGWGGKAPTLLGPVEKELTSITGPGDYLFLIYPTE
jgi:hypothetical protein